MFDWEVYRVYLRQRFEGGSPEAAAEAVETRYKSDIVLESHDIHLFVGTHFEHQNQFSAIGVYYPPLVQRTEPLF